ncbi:hypothetical protein L1987_38169 [Smallanthus sonchifolius]|uniref:Uncharacterized protein n=1 Tax=Smallanthus sonchifolius TaxID=185202 RepID=A0ACB9HIF9_9ASTR|nr:hypothetical protein L1987_38169 [Smallanthus sonchifolius]
MAQIPNLHNGPINFTSIRDKSRKELITILKNVILPSHGTNCFSSRHFFFMVFCSLVPTVIIFVVFVIDFSLYT